MSYPLVLLLVQMGFSFLALGVLTVTVYPYLVRLPRKSLVEVLLWLHVPRAIPLGLLAPGQAPGLDVEVASTIAWGDFTCAALALGAIAALKWFGKSASRFVQVFHAASIVDILAALGLGLGSGVYAHSLGFSWFVLTLYVPVVCVSQGLLLTIGQKSGSDPALANGARVVSETAV